MRKAMHKIQAKYSISDNTRNKIPQFGAFLSCKHSNEQRNVKESLVKARESDYEIKYLL